MAGFPARIYLVSATFLPVLDYGGLLYANAALCLVSCGHFHVCHFCWLSINEVDKTSTSHQWRHYIHTHKNTQRWKACPKMSNSYWKDWQPVTVYSAYSQLSTNNTVTGLLYYVMKIYNIIYKHSKCLIECQQLHGEKKNVQEYICLA